MCMYSATEVTLQLTYLVVIHDSVEGLDPHRINVSIKDNPLRVIPSHIGHISHDTGKQT